MGEDQLLNDLQNPESPKAPVTFCIHQSSAQVGVAELSKHLMLSPQPKVARSRKEKHVGFSWFCLFYSFCFKFWALPRAQMGIIFSSRLPVAANRRFDFVVCFGHLERKQSLWPSWTWKTGRTFHATFQIDKTYTRTPKGMLFGWFYVTKKLQKTFLWGSWYKWSVKLWYVERYLVMLGFLLEIWNFSFGHSVFHSASRACAEVCEWWTER